MKRDFWFYQEQDVGEPFAAHIYIVSKNRLNMRVYAEYLPAKTFLDVPISHRELVRIFSEVVQAGGMLLTSRDLDQIESLYMAIMQDVQFLER